MSRGAILSITGLYNADDTIFDLMQFPSKFTEEQKENVKQNILIDCAELECLYPNPIVMKNIIGIWSRKELPYWERVYNASLLEYNPIENYRRNEVETIKDDRTEKHSGSDVNQASGSDTSTGKSDTKYTEDGQDTVNNNITGFDSDILVPNTQTITEYGKEDTTRSSADNKTSYGRNDTFIHGENIDHSGNVDRSVLAYGNIGIVSSQDMLTQELEIAKIINVVPVIIESFINRFCLMVY